MLLVFITEIPKGDQRTVFTFFWEGKKIRYRTTNDDSLIMSDNGMKSVDMGEIFRTDDVAKTDSSVGMKIAAECEDFPTADIAKAESSVPSCPICLCDLDDQTVYITCCNHAFCQICIEMLFAGSSLSSSVLPNCPLCRHQLQPLDKQNTINVSLPPFCSDNYPTSPSFAFIPNEFDRRMIQSAYESICEQNKWETLYDYKVDETRGFLFNCDDDIVHIMNIIDAKYGGHSGCSIAFTMRFMHFISQYGFLQFERFYKNE